MTRCAVQGSDPSQYEMIQKMQMLQKRLINKTEEVVEKELLIQEKEKLYMELKHILARQPGPEVAEQLQTYQATLKEKTRQMKVFTSGVPPCLPSSLFTSFPTSPSFPPSPYLYPPYLPLSLLWTALGVLGMLSVLQRLGDAYGF